MSRKITRADIERVIREEAAAGRTPTGRDKERTDQEYAARLWLRLAGIDPDAVPVPADDVIDARALEKAREVIARRYIAPGVVAQLEVWRDQLNGRK